MLNMLNMLDFLGEPQALTPPKIHMLNFFLGFRQIRNKNAPDQGNVKHFLGFSQIREKCKKNAPDQGNVKHVWLRGKESLTFPGKC